MPKRNLPKIPKTRVRDLARWLELSLKDKKRSCPFEKRYGKGRQRFTLGCKQTCLAIFPSILLRYPAERSGDIDCPCIILSDDYVIRTARRIVREQS